MQVALHRADTRGHASHGWLDTWHTFSFADYFNPERIHFGALRVLNDDWIKGGTGFGRHPHDNMEIVTIMLEGEIRHSDSMGHVQVLHKDEVQAMSAGTGIFHAEENNLPDSPVRLLQIWVFPKERNIAPRYDQRFFDPLLRKNNWQLLAGPNPKNGALELKQQAWFSRIDIDKGRQVTYPLNSPQNGVYLFNISGAVGFENGGQLKRRDGAGIYNTRHVVLSADEDSELLVIEVPMWE
jgi:quercetin 2,3-dioxygenase